MNPLSTRLAVVLLGDRLVTAVLRWHDLQVFVVDAEHAAETLRAELDQRRLRVRSVALALPRTAVTVKPVDLPAVDGDLQEMVRFELDRHLPFASEDPPFDAVALPAPAGPGAEARAARVLVAAAERRTMDGALRLAEDAKLRPRTLTVASHDLVNLVRLPRRGRVAWLHGVGERAELLLLDGRALVLSRSLSTTDPGALVDEIRRSLPAARWAGCDALWLSGDGLDRPGAGGSFDALGVPVGEPPWAAWLRSRLATLPRETAGALVLAVGAVVGPRGRPLDLLPRRLRPRQVTRGQLVTAAMVLIALGLGAGALLVPGELDRRHLVGLDQQIVRLAPDVRAVEQTLAELERKRRLLATVQGLERASLRPLPVLRELTDLLPVDAWLTSLTLDGKGVELTGQAATASALIPLLENSPRFQGAEFASPVTRGRDKEQFRIRASWEASAAEPDAPRPPARKAPATRAPQERS